MSVFPFRSRFAFAVLAVVVTTSPGGCMSDKSQPTNPSSGTTTGASKSGNPDETGPGSVETAKTQKVSSGNLEQDIIQFCGDCHNTPSPDRFPRLKWEKEVMQGYRFYLNSRRTDLFVPDQREVIAWYQKRAPKTISPPESVGDYQDDSPVRFTPVTVPIDKSVVGAKSDGRPGVSYLKWDLDASGAKRLRLTDMWLASVADFQLRDHSWSIQQSVSAARYPAHAVRVDLFGTGRPGLLVSELGSFLPGDHDSGAVLWFSPTEDGKWKESPLPLQLGIGRVASCTPVDLDADGDLDIVVAEFGWRRTGSLFALENRNPIGVEPTSDNVKFEKRELDPRHGAIHVVSRDVNSDGRPDLLVLFAQEHERVELFTNQGDWKFEARPVARLPDPSDGSSGMAIVDLDGDNDDDIIVTNGDTFDSGLLRREHSVRWFENTGDWNFKAHVLTSFPAVHRALAADLDNDGDLDIVAVGLKDGKSVRSAPRGLASVMWLEQTSRGEFKRHILEIDESIHPTLEVGDFDEDGDIDFVVGNFAVIERQSTAGWFTVWWNETVPNRQSGNTAAR